MVVVFLMAPGWRAAADFAPTPARSGGGVALQFRKQEIGDAAHPRAGAHVAMHGEPHRQRRQRELGQDRLDQRIAFGQRDAGQSRCRCRRGSPPRRRSDCRCETRMRGGRRRSPSAAKPWIRSMRAVEADEVMAQANPRAFAAGRAGRDRISPRRPTAAGRRSCARSRSCWAGATMRTAMSASRRSRFSTWLEATISTSIAGSSRPQPGHDRRQHIGRDDLACRDADGAGDLLGGAGGEPGEGVRRLAHRLRALEQRRALLGQLVAACVRAGTARRRAPARARRYGGRASAGWPRACAPLPTGCRSRRRRQSCGSDSSRDRPFCLFDFE